jgi:hypothetical protein
VTGPVPCAGQLLDLPPGRYDWVRLELAEETAVACRPDPPEVWLHYEDAVDPEWLHVPPGATATRVGVARPSVLRSVRLPSLPGAGVLALTLVPADE